VIDGKRVLALVTARGGSKGLPGKNVLPFAGKPLIAWTIEAARQSQFVDRCVLSTDDQRIAAVGLSFGADVPFMRDASLASDESTSMDVVFDALARVPGFDYIVLLQPTSPLRTAAHIDTGLTVLTTTGADSVVAVCQAQDHPLLTFRWDAANRLVPFCEQSELTRRQDMPAAFVLNGAFYAAPIATLTARRSFTRGSVAAFEMSREESADIDDWNDFRAAEQRFLERSQRIAAASQRGT
jgi:CMP-N,N'-diacetyllegionaminic acid synthase